MTTKKKLKSVRLTGRKLLDEHLEPLPVPLTNDELLARGQSLVRLRDEERKAESEFDKHKHAHKEAIAAISEEREMLEQAIRDKREKRSVRVEGWAEYQKGRYEAIRTDTGEVIGDRPLHPEEMQETIDFDAPPGDAQ